MAETDAKLVERTLAGEKGAFGEIVRRHVGGLYSYAFGLTGSRAEAGDLVQEGILRAYRQLHGLADPARIVAWLSDSILAVHKEWIRKKTKTFESVAPETSGEGTAPPDPLADDVFPAVARVLAAIDESSRTVLTQRFLKGLSAEQIGELTGESPASMHPKITRAIKVLREPLSAVVDLSALAQQQE